MEPGGGKVQPRIRERKTLLIHLQGRLESGRENSEGDTNDSWLPGTENQLGLAQQKGILLCVVGCLISPEAGALMLPVCVANPRAVNVKAVTSLRFSQDA